MQNSVSSPDKISSNACGALRIEELDEVQRSVLDSNHKKMQEKETLAHADGVHVTGHS